MIKIPFVGGSNEARSANASIQRSVNVYLEVDQKNERAPIALYGTPGMTLRVTAGTSVARGALRFSSSYAYWVVGNTVYRMDTSYVLTSCGTINTSSGRVGMASNGTEVIIVDGTDGWLVNGTTLTEITDADFPNGVTVATAQDGYFLVAGDSTGRLYWNETPNSGTSWVGTDFSTAEGKPDNTIGLLSNHRELWVVGTESTEIFINTGDSDALFARSGNTFIEQGTVSGWTVQPMDSTVYWLGASKEGEGIVFKADGYNPRRISTHAMEQKIRGYSTISDAFAFTYQFDGHSFYVLTFPTANKTWFWDEASQEWFEWVWRNPSDNSENRHRANCCVFFNRKQLVGDWENGKISSLEMDVYTDVGPTTNTDAILRKRVTQTTSEDGARLFFEDLQIDRDTGVGLASGQGSDPMLMIRYSNDNGHSWSNIKNKSIGQQGQYTKRVKFGPTGSGRNRCWELTMTDPVKLAIFGAWATVTKGY
jgi:hypothetical protein